MARPAQSVDSERIAAAADERIAELVGNINAATAELVSVIRDVLATDAWCGAGLRSPAHWLAWRAGLSPARAAALVQMAQRLAHLPTVESAFSDGRRSEDSVKLISARVPAERDVELAELAQPSTPVRPPS